MPKGTSHLHSPRYRQFREKLVQARLDADLTQVQVADKLKKEQSWVSKSERGDRRVDFVELEDLAKLYRKPLSYFSTRKSRSRS